MQPAKKSGPSAFALKYQRVYACYLKTVGRGRECRVPLALAHVQVQGTNLVAAVEDYILVDRLDMRFCSKKVFGFVHCKGGGILRKIRPSFKLGVPSFFVLRGHA
jgi:hypothetical protein